MSNTPITPEEQAYLQYILGGGNQYLGPATPALGMGQYNMLAGLVPFGDDDLVREQARGINLGQDITSSMADTMMGAMAGLGAYDPTSFEPLVNESLYDSPELAAFNTYLANPNSFRGSVAQILKEGGDPMMLFTDLQEMLGYEPLDYTDAELNPVARELPWTTDQRTGQPLAVDWPGVQAEIQKIVDQYSAIPQAGPIGQEVSDDGSIVSEGGERAWTYDDSGRLVVSETTYRPSPMTEEYRRLGLPDPTQQFTPEMLMGPQWEQAQADLQFPDAAMREAQARFMEQQQGWNQMMAGNPNAPEPVINRQAIRQPPPGHGAPQGLAPSILPAAEIGSAVPRVPEMGNPAAAVTALNSNPDFVGWSVEEVADWQADRGYPGWTPQEIAAYEARQTAQGQVEQARSEALTQVPANFSDPEQLVEWAQSNAANIPSQLWDEMISNSEQQIFSLPGSEFGERWATAREQLLDMRAASEAGQIAEPTTAPKRQGVARKTGDEPEPPGGIWGQLTDLEAQQPIGAPGQQAPSTSIPNYTPNLPANVPTSPPQSETATTVWDMLPWYMRQGVPIAESEGVPGGYASPQIAEALWNYQRGQMETDRAAQREARQPAADEYAPGQYRVQLPPGTPPGPQPPEPLTGLAPDETAPGQYRVQLPPEGRQIYEYLRNATERGLGGMGRPRNPALTEAMIRQLFPQGTGEITAANYGGGPIGEQALTDAMLRQILPQRTGERTPTGPPQSERATGIRTGERTPTSPPQSERATRIRTGEKTMAEAMQERSMERAVGAFGGRRRALNRAREERNRTFQDFLRQKSRVYNEDYGRALAESMWMQSQGITPTTAALAARQLPLAAMGVVSPGQLLR